MRLHHLFSDGACVGKQLMKGFLIASVPVLLITAAFMSNGTPTNNSSETRAVDPQIEAMKKCAREAKLARARWYFEEPGIMTTPDSGVASQYNNRLAALGIAPKQPIPDPVCG